MPASEKTKKSSKLQKFWKRSKTKVKRFKAPKEGSEPSCDAEASASTNEATPSSNHKTSKLNIFKKKKKTPVKAFKKQSEQEDSDKTKWHKVKLSSAAVKPSDIYKKK